MDRGSGGGGGDGANPQCTNGWEEGEGGGGGQINVISCFWVYTNRLINCFCVVFWCLYHACSSRL